MTSKLWIFTIHKGAHPNLDDKLADEPLSPAILMTFPMTGSKTNKSETYALIAPPAGRYDLPRLSFRKLLAA